MVKEKNDKKAVVRVPKKTRINLAKKEKKTASLYTLIIGMTVIAVLVFCTAKFGVIDQYNRLNRAEAEYNSIHVQYVATNDEIASYDAVMAEYRKYSRDWMINDDTGKFVAVDRTEMLDLIERDLMSKGTVNKVSIYGEQALIEMSGMTLKEISEMFMVVQEEPIVWSATLNIAATEEEQATASILNFSITIVFQNEAEEAES